MFRSPHLSGEKNEERRTPAKLFCVLLVTVQFHFIIESREKELITEFHEQEKNSQISVTNKEQQQ
jgi:hypothetical protein